MCTLFITLVPDYAIVNEYNAAEWFGMAVNQDGNLSEFTSIGIRDTNN